MITKMLRDNVYFYFSKTWSFVITWDKPMKLTYFTFTLIILTLGCTNKDAWFVIEKIDEQTFAITEPGSTQRNSSFLIIGEKEAILFDAGTGEGHNGSILDIVETMTSLKTTLILSHFHYDHIGNLRDFKEIGVSEAQLIEIPMLADSTLTLTQKETFSKGSITVKATRVFPEGEIIDLGNRTIGIIHTPGHTNESISLLDHERAYIFTGDLVYNGLLLVDNCNTYLNSLNSIMEISKPRYRIFGSHGKPEVEYRRIPQIKAAIECYINNDYSPESVSPTRFFGSDINVYNINNISFIVDYSSVLEKDSVDTSGAFSYSQYDSLSAVNINNLPQDSVTTVYNEAVSLLRRSKSDLALEKLFRLKETVGLNHTLTDKITVSIAEGYRQRQEYEKGLDLLYELLNKPNITFLDQANALNRIAALYNEGPPFPSKYDSVIKYSYQCIEIAEKNGFTAELAASQNELGFVYGTISTYKNYSKAIELLNAALENFRSLGLHQNAVNVSINLSQIYLELSDFDKALQVIDTAIASCSEEDNKNLFYRAYYIKASIYEKQGNYEKAYEYLNKSSYLSNSFFKDRLNTEIFEMAAKYETEKKERENLELRKNNEIQALKLSYKNNAIAFLSIGLCVAGILLLVIFSLLQRKKIAYKNLVKKNIELARWDEINSEAEDILRVEGKGINERQSANDRDKEEEIIENFSRYFAQEKPFFNSHISIEDVSARIGTNRTYLSKAINEVYRKSFNTIVNEFRIRAARQLITDTKHDHLSLEAIADMVGYSSRTTFISNFKKFTGLTPSYFRESIKKNLR
jgi:glyoxylase-like metal-dependent hydrolase (beta-lactamase superfamily II)/YesN/AraC family two-component response regulator